MRRSNERAAQKAYAIYTQLFQTSRIRKLAEEEVDLSAVGKLLQTIVDA